MVADAVKPARHTPRKLLAMFSMSSRSAQASTKVSVEREPTRSSVFTSRTSTSTRWSQANRSSILESTIRVAMSDPYDSDSEPDHPLSKDIKRNEHRELGYVSFRCENLAAAMAQARALKLPVAQIHVVEAGDIDAGMTVFSHPLVVEALETLFVGYCTLPDETGVSSTGCTTLNISNERGTRLLSVGGKDLSLASAVKAICSTLEQTGSHVPQYLDLLLDEVNTSTTTLRTALFLVSDTSQAEVFCAGIDPVLSTRVGKVAGRTAIELAYDARHIGFAMLVRKVLELDSVQSVCYQTNDQRVSARVEVSRVIKPVTVDKYESDFEESLSSKAALRGTPMRFVPMTRLQALRANRLISLGQFNKAVNLLSPRQGMILMEAMHHMSNDIADAVESPILDAWLRLSGDQVSTDETNYYDYGETPRCRIFAYDDVEELLPRRSWYE